MAYDFKDEMQMMREKLQHFGQYGWLDEVLPTWEKAYRAAYASYSDNLPTRAKGVWGPWDIVGLALGTTPLLSQYVFAPIAAALKDMLPLTGSDLALPKAASPDDFIGSLRIQYGRMIRAVSTQLMRNKDSNLPSEQFFVFRSVILHSPIWYPPKDLDESALALALENQLWASTFQKLLTETPALFIPQSGVDWSKTVNRLIDLKVIDKKDAFLFGMSQLEYGSKLRRWVERTTKQQSAPLQVSLPPYVITLLTLQQFPFSLPVQSMKPNAILKLTGRPYLDWSNVPM